MSPELYARIDGTDLNFFGFVTTDQIGTVKSVATSGSAQLYRPLGVNGILLLHMVRYDGLEDGINTTAHECG